MERIVITIGYIWFVFVFLAGCGTNKVSTRDVGSVEAAKKSYIEGIEALKDSNFAEAFDIFQQLSRGQQYIKYTGLAKLRAGDTLLLQDRYFEAIDIYRSFIETNEGNSNLHYAYFRLAEAYYKKIPVQFFLLAPLEEKDISPVIESFRTTDEFLSKYSNSPFAIKASEMYEQCFFTILGHELKIIEFYKSRDKPKAIVSRIESFFQEYPKSRKVEKLYILLGKEYLATGRYDRVIDLCNEYNKRFPFGIMKKEAKAIRYEAQRNLKL